MCFTDGSVIKDEGEGSQPIGAGVYHEALDIKACVDCAPYGATNTITRAELCGIKVCMDKAQAFGEEDCLFLATDSQACMHATGQPQTLDSTEK